MKKALMLGAAAAACALTTAATAKEYGFYTTSGSAYCDGLKLKAGTPTIGFHIYDQTYCSYPNAYLGGFHGSIAALGPGQWFSFATSQASGDGLPNGYVLFFFVNLKSMIWELAFESTDYAIPFEVINSGALMEGPPFARAGGRKIRQSTVHAGLARAGLPAK